MATESLWFTPLSWQKPGQGKAANAPGWRLPRRAALLIGIRHPDLAVRSYSFETPPMSATQRLAPSKEAPEGANPTGKIPRTPPSLARSLVTLALDVFVIQMLAPSKTTLLGKPPTEKVPSTVPSLARSLVTLLPNRFATQTLAPSKAIPQ